MLATPEVVASSQQPTSPPKRQAVKSARSATAPVTAKPAEPHANTPEPVATAAPGTSPTGLAPVEEKTETVTLAGAPGPPAQTGGVAAPAEPTAPAPPAATTPATQAPVAPTAAPPATPPVIAEPVPSPAEDGPAAPGTGGVAPKP